ncbi:hypothetical protein OXYTRIMIC_319 [Oxytricha trifallax]|uniref:Uncharacterized protein n=1 Tax=Oxytricha trifallax TaxID=1172189 RepID=A0A073HXQ2_9SPIT|nr:hypothetical protein OXYTRIMIC_319 [Oxytricha trifallax]
MIKILECFKEIEITHNLKLNQKKTVFMSDSKEFKDVNTIDGIAKVEQVKYLGMNIRLDTKTLLKGTWDEIKKQTYFYQSLTRSNNATICDTIMVAQIRSLIIYKYTPLVATGYVKLEEIDKIETQLKRIAFKTPRDIPNRILRNITQLKESETKEIIEQLVLKSIKKVKNSIEKYLKPKETKNLLQEKKQELQKRKKLFITKNVMDTMMAINQGRTIVSYGMSHYCNVHKTFVNSIHMKNCNLMNEAGDPTRFNKVLRDHRLIDLNFKTQIEIIANMVWLDERIRGLENRGYYQKIKKLFKVAYVKKQQIKAEDLNGNLE